MPDSHFGHNSATPCVTIGMPVYNGGKFIDAAIQSILAQTHQNFTLVIADNASTDETQTICRRYARLDKRIHYIRNETNIGASLNCNKLFKLCSTEYFKLCAHDDILLPTYLESCVSVLEKDPSVALCHSRTKYIDFSGRDIPYSDNEHAFVDQSSGYSWRFDPEGRQLDSRSPTKRFDDFIRKTITTLEVWGVIRNTLLQKVRPFSPYFGSDRVTLADLILLGRFVEIDDVLFLKRCHEEQVTIQPVADRAAACGAENPKTVRFSGALCFLDYLSVIKHCSLRFWQKAACLLSLGRLVVRKETMFKLFVPGAYNYFGIDFDLSFLKSFGPGSIE